MSEFRTVERLIKGTWLPCMLEDLHIGQVFRMFEPSGEPVVGKHNSVEWIVTGNPYLNEQNIWTVNIEYFNTPI